MRIVILAAAAMLGAATAAPAFAQTPSDTTSQIQHGSDAALAVRTPGGQPAQPGDTSAFNKTTGQLTRGQGAAQTMVEPSAPPRAPNTTQTDAPGNQTTGEIQRNGQGAQTGG